LGGVVDISDEKWAKIKPLIPKPPPKKDGRGRPRRDSREVFNGILWVLRTGAPWADLPARYPPYQTCHRRFQEWVRCKAFENILRALARDMKEEGKLDLKECFIDGTFVAAKKGDSVWGRPSGGLADAGAKPKVRSLWLSQTVLVFLSPYTRKALARMKSPLLKELLSPDLLKISQNAS
jgi:transposase